MFGSRSAEPLQLDRRQALAVLSGTAFGGLFNGPNYAHATAVNDPVFVSSAMLQSGGHAVVTVDSEGALLSTFPLSDRGHDFAVRADGLIVAFARRPGTFAVAFYARNRSTGDHRVFSSPADRHFNGHGAFSRDGRLLYASENDFDAAVGCIGIYDAQTFTRLGEMPSGGVGPHEILQLPNGHLAIANGGIATHPDFPRAKLNLDEMRPNITILDPKHGDLVEREELAEELHQLSIRHMAWSSAADELWFGCQWEGEAGVGIPLVGRYHPGGAVELLPSPQGGWKLMRDYIGSVAVSADAGTIVATSPRGGRAIVWDRTGKVRGISSIPDVSGVAFSASTPTLSSGNGALHVSQREVLQPNEIAGFDNHLAVVR